MALGGLILGWLSVGLGLLAVVAIILFFGGLAAFLAVLAAHGGH
jgi:hypothetical protein